VVDVVTAITTIAAFRAFAIDTIAFTMDFRIIAIITITTMELQDLNP